MKEIPELLEPDFTIPAELSDTSEITKNLSDFFLKAKKFYLKLEKEETLEKELDFLSPHTRNSNFNLRK